MIIRNKFNGYGFDGSRLCHDPVSLSIAATQAGAASSAAATAAAAQAATTAAGTAAAQAAAQAAATEAAKTAGLEAAKQSAVQAGTQQLGQQAAQEAAKQAAQQGIAQTGQQGLAQVGQQALTQTGQEAAIEAAKQGGVEGMKQGIFSANPAGIPTTASPIPPTGPLSPAQPLPPAGSVSPTLPDGSFNQAYAEQLGQRNIDRLAAEGFRVADPSQAQQLIAGEGAPNVIKDVAFNQGAVEKGLANAATNTSKSVVFNQPPQPPYDPSQALAFKSNVPTTYDPSTAWLQPKVGTQIGPDTFANVAKEQAGIDQLVQHAIPPNPNPFPLAPMNPLKKGFLDALEFVGENKINTGLGLMAAGQYMNKPEEEDKDKYKNTVDMSEFQPSIPTQRPFTRSYEYQSYAVGGPVEQMAAMNAVGMNTGYPMAGINTPVYSNPMMQRPEATNVIAPSADAGVGTYSGEPRYAEGGISAAERREYGLTTRGQRAARNLTKSYEEMEEERQKEAMKLFGERSDPGIVPRSRTQMLSSPFSAAMAEHARLGKKAKVPVVEMPKTNLGDIDTYMDIPIEAASGGIMHGLGGYSDGGRLLKGPGDGVSDSIPAVIGKRQPARLADGEFVIPARIVSELGNGSTEAGARKLYAMMERVQNARKKSIGKKKVAVNSKADKHLPA